MTFECHWKNMQRRVGTKHLVIRLQSEMYDYIPIVFC